MTRRDRVHLATSALLYLGPLFAGLAGYGFEVTPAFAAVLVLWLAVMRPGDWPSTPEAWRVPRAVAWPFLIFCGQIAVVSFCLAVGRGFSGVFDVALPLPLVLSLLMSMLGVAVARLMLRGDGTRPKLTPDAGLSIGSGILDMPTPVLPGQRDIQGMVAGAMNALAERPASGAPRLELAPVLEFVVREELVPEMLVALAEAPHEHLPYVQAQAALALRPDVAPNLAGQGKIGAAVARAFGTRVPKLMQATAEDVARLIPRFPGLAIELPGAPRILSAAADIERSDPVAARALRTLAQILSDDRRVA